MTQHAEIKREVPDLAHKGAEPKPKAEPPRSAWPPSDGTVKAPDDAVPAKSGSDTVPVKLSDDQWPGLKKMITESVPDEEMLERGRANLAKILEKGPEDRESFEKGPEDRESFEITGTCGWKRIVVTHRANISDNMLNEDGVPNWHWDDELGEYMEIAKKAILDDYFPDIELPKTWLARIGHQGIQQPQGRGRRRSVC